MAIRSYKLSILVAVSLTIFAFGAVYSVPAQAPDIQPLIQGTPIDRELKGDAPHSYTIALQPKQFLHLAVEQKHIDLKIALFDPLGKKLMDVDHSNGPEGSEHLYYLAEVAGTYRIQILQLEKNVLDGRYEVTIEVLRFPTEEDNARIAAELCLSQAELLSQTRTASSLRDAIKKFDECATLYRAIRDQKQEALVFLNTGFIYGQFGETQNALETYQRALPLFRAVNDRSDEATVLNNIGNIFASFGENQKAIDSYLQALHLYRVVGHRQGQANTLIGIGFYYASIGENEKALDFHSQALPLARAFGDRSLEAYALDNIGSVYSSLGEKQKALELFMEALPIAREVGNPYGEALTLASIGSAYDSLGEKQKALDYYLLALPINRRVGDRSHEADTIAHIAGAYYALGDKQKSLEFFTQALALWRQVSDRAHEADALNKIGVIYNSLGETRKAVDYYAQALILRRFVGDRRGEAETFDKLYFTFSTSNPRLSVFYSKQAIESFEMLRGKIRGLNKDIQQSYLRSIEGTYRRLANALFEQGRFPEAQQVLNLFKNQQYFDHKSDTSVTPIARTDRENQLVSELDAKLDSVVSVFRQVDDIKRTIGTKQPTSDQKTQLAILEAKLSAIDGEFRSFINRAETEFASPPDRNDKILSVLDQKAMQAFLREGSTASKQQTVALYTLVGEENYRALIITPDSIEAVSLPIKGDDLNKKALELWRLLRTPKYDPRPLAKEIYDLVFAPIKAKLPKDTKTILWSLDGNLRYIPMAALYDGDKYMVERYNNVVFTRSGGEAVTRSRSATVIGTGMGSSEAHTVELAGLKFNAASLPGVKTELSQIFNNGTSRGVLTGDVLLDSQFTRASMISSLRKHNPIVHVASHFKFEPGDEARSFLLLGDGTPFTLDEMKTQTDLFAGVDLLTLSACQTAAQRPDANGREVDGFAELAQRLGAGAVMASLWEVSDNSTAELMSRFYRGYVKDGKNKADAIGDAQRALLNGGYKTDSTSERQLTHDDKDAESIRIDPAKLISFKPKKGAPYSHPYYWSPFILIGNWR